MEGAEEGGSECLVDENAQNLGDAMEALGGEADGGLGDVVGREELDDRVQLPQDLLEPQLVRLVCVAHVEEVHARGGRAPRRAGRRRARLRERRRARMMMKRCSSCAPSGRALGECGLPSPFPF